MRSVNKAILIGSLGKDAETAFLQSGTAKTTFSLATSRRWKDQSSGEWREETDWHNVVAWKQENLANFLLKGTPVYVEGRISNRKYEKDGQTRYITEIVADVVNLLGGKSEDRSESASAPARRGGSAGAGKISENLGVSADDCPFIAPLSVETRWV